MAFLLSRNACSHVTPEVDVYFSALPKETRTTGRAFQHGPSECEGPCVAHCPGCVHDNVLLMVQDVSLTMCDEEALAAVHA